MVSSITGSQQNLSPGFLYTGTVKKLHKRQKNKYQTRKLVIYSSKIDYFKSETNVYCGTIPMEGVRAEISLDTNHTFEILYDDIKERQFVFTCKEDYVRATIIWIINCEQFQTYGPTLRNLTKETLNYMESFKTNASIRTLISMKYEKAAKHFLTMFLNTSSSVFVGQSTLKSKIEYEDPSTLGIYRKDPLDDEYSSTSDEEFYFENEKMNSPLKGETIPIIPISKDTYMSASQVHSLKSNSLQGNSCKNKRILSQTSSIDSTRSRMSQPANHGQTVIYNLAAGDNLIDFGARDVNAIKAKVSGHNDFIEIDMKYVGNTIADFRRILCTELKISDSMISCIRKLPDVLVRNDEDISRIKSGRQFEVELLD